MHGEYGILKMCLQGSLQQHSTSESLIPWARRVARCGLGAWESRALFTSSLTFLSASSCFRLCSSSSRTFLRSSRFFFSSSSSRAASCCFCLSFSNSSLSVSPRRRRSSSRRLPASTCEAPSASLASLALAPAPGRLSGNAKEFDKRQSGGRREGCQSAGFASQTKRNLCCPSSLDSGCSHPPQG